MSMADYLKGRVNHDTAELIGMATGLNGLFDRSMTWFLREELRDNGVGLEEIVGGMDQLPHRMAERLKTPIEFGTRLLGIRNLDDGKVELTLSRNGGPPFTETDSNVLVTLPFSVMRGIQTPTFSRGKHEAIREMSYGSATKVLLDTKERFWELNEHIHGGASHSDGINGATYYPSDNVTASSPEEQDKVSHGPGALVGSYVWGQDARRLGAMTPEDREKAVVASVARIHPEIAEPGMVKDYATISWDENPWSAGAFGMPTPGQHALYREAIKPEGNVHFAGEHTSLDQGWIQGALISSLRAVEEIVTQKP
jgi:monoamine oxidase